MQQSSQEHNKVTFGVDFDGTITSDPVGFLVLIDLLKSRGHKVYLVTMRYPSECVNDPLMKEFYDLVDGVIPTSRMAKKEVCDREGIKIHIWIEDTPKAVHMCAKDIWGFSSSEGHCIIEQHSN